MEGWGGSLRKEKAKDALSVLGLILRVSKLIALGFGWLAVGLAFWRTKILAKD
jgi:hypothetical protein